MPKVSVIIPVYNVEEYIARCCVSLFEQSLDDIEYIFVNDATSDRSIDIIKKTLELFPNRQTQAHFYVHNKNLGSAATRKTGIINATGEYIIHCDGDDWIEKDMYKSMYDMAVSKRLDIVKCDFVRDRPNHSSVCHVVSEDIYSDKLKCMAMVMTGNDFSSLCDKLVRREVVNRTEILYPQHNMQEDLVLVLQYYYYSNRVGYIPHAYYHYCYNDNSISRTRNEHSIISRMDDVVQNTFTCECFLSNQGLSEIYRDEIICQKLSARNHISSLVHIPKYYNLWKNSFPEIDSKVLRCNKVSVSEKIIWALIWLRLFYPLRLLKQRITCFFYKLK